MAVCGQAKLERVGKPARVLKHVDGASGVHISSRCLFRLSMLGYPVFGPQDVPGESRLSPPACLAWAALSALVNKQKATWDGSGGQCGTDQFSSQLQSLRCRNDYLKETFGEEAAVAGAQLRCLSQMTGDWILQGFCDKRQARSYPKSARSYEAMLEVVSQRAEIFE